MAGRKRTQASDEPREEKLLEFAEEFALVYELDVPRIAGKILGYLLVCDPPTRTQRELAEMLSASRGSVSTMTRLLERFGWIERVSVPGQRQVRYRVGADAWARHAEVHLERAHSLYNVAVRGQSLLESSRPGITERIDITVEFLDYWRHGMPLLLDGWKERNETRAIS